MEKSYKYKTKVNNNNISIKIYQINNNKTVLTKWQQNLISKIGLLIIDLKNS